MMLKYISISIMSLRFDNLWFCLASNHDGLDFILYKILGLVVLHYTTANDNGNSLVIISNC
jgi:hypothetical protein